MWRGYNILNKVRCVRYQGLQGLLSGQCLRHWMIQSGSPLGHMIWKLTTCCLTATLNHFKVSFLVTHIFNRNKLAFNFNFIIYSFYPRVFSSYLNVVTISRKSCLRPWLAKHIVHVYIILWILQIGVSEDFHIIYYMIKWFYHTMNSTNRCIFI